VSYNYAVGSNPLVASVADTAGTITTTVDILGRVMSYVDVWGDTTTSTYNQPGRLVGNGRAFAYFQIGVHLPFAAWKLAWNARNRG